MSDPIFHADLKLLGKSVGFRAGQENSSSRKSISQEPYLTVLIQLLFCDESHVRMTKKKKKKLFASLRILNQVGKSENPHIIHTFWQKERTNLRKGLT